ncbi:MAG TPA: bifunctional DNA-formamidopyrimidine glycosylase/DNA-(apurinic or apyrimidinic site) lyase [candidate division Zixibacteria bacterium]|nr:bifunctional DNA-formamidopyrimidine glycosylase/DNA-(apurinic or apyrimidinic site) lyase [candidate division Zixibacteria bacterium]
MPELPEVETVVRGLRETVVSRTIKQVKLNAPPATIVVGRAFAERGFERSLVGKRIERVDRRGKNILIRLSGDATLWAHLKMTGHFFWVPRSAPINKHDLAVFRFRSENGKGACRLEENILKFNDYRRFGRLRLFDNEELMQQPGIASLGPEPLEISPDEFVELFRRTTRMIKPALMDQTFIAGLGNIYADESLYAARIHPRRLTSSISRRKLIELHGIIQTLLLMAIDNMGTSVDSYSGVNGNPGGFQKYLKAYNNESLPCERCGTIIIREKIGSRSAHFCPRCQKAPKG